MSGAILETYNPFFNLAVEDFLLHNCKGDYFLVSVNDPSVIVGRHQIIFREVDVFTAGALNIPVIRRISGGGTVYHDRGNLNFTFIRNCEKERQVDFNQYIQPVIEFLNVEGVPSVMSGKSDITVNDHKVSGNAEYVFRDRILHHGTLMFDTSIEVMKQLIRPLTDTYTTKAVESKRSAVTNLKGRLKNINTIDELASEMMRFMKDYFNCIKNLSFTDVELSEIKSIAEKKYMSWDWNYGFTPSYTFTSDFEIDGNTGTVRMLVKDGIIWECNITGNEKLARTGKMLIGRRHLFDDIKKVFLSEGVMISDEALKRFF
ncbi:MAG: lipoate--protein ligase [Bacteroidales bacterium]|nr:lipoate--protein ligase [Bacteroidales bacterium]